jgi:plastocyanin domain-containing protein
MKSTVISILIAGVLIGGAIMLSGDKGSSSNTQQAANNVTIVDGKQIITINAKGSYSPKITTAKADMPTVIKMTTQGTFDCTSALTIPSIGYRGNLPPSGETLIDVPPQQAGATIRGICAMGMYNFAVNFN